jgi:hypothetical protein
MDFNQQQVDHTAANADEFLIRNAGVLPKTVASSVRLQLTVQLKELRALAAQQGIANTQLPAAAEAKAASRDVLFRQHIAPAVTMATTVFKDQPGLEGIALPNPKLGVAKLTQAVEGIVGVVGPHAQQFVAAGLAQDFIAQLQSAAAALHTSVAAHATSVGQRIEATSGLAPKSSQIVRTLQALDRMVRAELDPASPLLSDWKNAKRIRRAPSKSAGTAAPATAGNTPPALAASAPATTSVPVVSATPVASTPEVTAKTA